MTFFSRLAEKNLDIDAFADEIVNNFKKNLNPAALTDLTTLTSNDRGANTHVGDVLKTTQVYSYLSEFNGLKDLEKIITDTILLREGRDADNRNILHYAVMRNDVAMVKLILHLDPELMNIPDAGGITPLFLAVTKDNYICLEWMLNASLLNPLAKPDLTICESTAHATPLHAAAIRGFFSISILLQEKGANVNAENKYGMTPADCALFQLHSYNTETGARVSDDFSKVKKFMGIAYKLKPARGYLEPQVIVEKLGMKEVPPPKDIRKKV